MVGSSGVADDAHILTVSAELGPVAAVVPTANEWVALPDLDAHTGTIASANVLHDGAAGLIEFRGEPLSAPAVTVAGIAVPDDAWDLEVEVGLLPRWRTDAGGCAFTVTVACPPGHKGFVQTLVGVNRGEQPVEVTLGFAGHTTDVSLHVFSDRPIDGPHRWKWDSWTRALVEEVSTGLPLAALAVRAEDGAAPLLDDGDGFGAETPGAEVPATEVSGHGIGVRWSHRRELELGPGEEGSLALLFGVGREADGAGLAAVDLARHGSATLIARTHAWLDARRGPTLADRPALQAVRDRNRLFGLTFAAGRTIDTESLVLVTSRSPRYDVSAAHWTRDSLLWAFPAVLAVDTALAAEWLRAAFSRYARNPGIHALYLDGGVLHPGFELDEVCAFHLALDAYLEATGDASLVDEPAVREGLRRVDAALDGARDTATGLYATFLLSTDDPAPHPYVTYPNALTVAALRARARTHWRTGNELGGERSDHAADELWDTVLDRCVVDGPFGPMLCGATDGYGDTVCFDEPPGSLELLAYRGLLAPDDPLFTATVAWINSEHHRHGPGDGRYATPTCDHARHPWVLAVGNALLRGEKRWLDDLPALPLDGGFACETFDAMTGEPRTGLGFATCAGWLAHAIDVATRPVPHAAAGRATDVGFRVPGPASDPFGRGGADAVGPA